MYNQVNVQHVKNHFGKPTTLILSLTLFVAVVASSVMGLFTVEAINSLFTNLQNAFGILDLGDFEYDLSVTSSLSSTIVSFISSLIPVGLWVWIFFSSKSKNINTKPKAPLTVCFVFSILGIIASSLLVILSGIFLVLGIGFAYPYTNLTSYEHSALSLLGDILIFLSVVLLFFSVIAIIYYSAKTKFFSSANKSMTSDKMVVSGKVYGIFSIVRAITTLLTSVGVILLGFAMLNSNFDPYIISGQREFSSFTDLIPFLGISDDISIITIIIGFTGFITVFAFILEGIIALGYNKMAKTVPPTPNFNPYNNSYNQFNQYNQNPYNNFNNSNYNNQNFNNGQYNNPSFNQSYPNNQGFVNQQSNFQQAPSDDNSYNDGFDMLNQQLDNQINNQLNDDTDLNNNPYINK